MREFHLTPAQAELLPTDADIAFYEREGYYVSRPGVIPDALIARAIAGAERFYRGEVDTSLPLAEGFSNTLPSDDTSPRNNEFISLQMREFAELIAYPLIGAIAARLTGSAEIRLLDDQLIWKPSAVGAAAKSTITGWHADRAYWATCSSDNLVTAWIPLHDIEPARSPLAVMAGSHRWSGLQDMRFFNDKNLDDLQDALREQGKDVRVVPLIMKQGQLSFHHGWTMHAGFPNTSGQPRMSFAAHLQDGDNRYRPFHNAQGREIHMIDEKLCRKLPNGDPDFADPAIFPTLWTTA